MALYLANCTKQTFIFSCRVQEYPKILSYHILSGKQEQIDKDLHLSPEQIGYIVEQMERYGFRNVTDINRKMADFDGMIYSTNKPIPSNDIQVANAALIEKQEKRSANEAVKSALGFERGTRDQKSKQRLASVTAVEIKQDVDKREGAKGNEISMNIEMSVEGHDRLEIV